MGYKFTFRIVLANLQLLAVGTILWFGSHREIYLRACQTWRFEFAFLVSIFFCYCCCLQLCYYNLNFFYRSIPIQTLSHSRCCLLNKIAFILKSTEFSALNFYTKMYGTYVSNTDRFYEQINLWVISCVIICKHYQL